MAVVVQTNVSSLEAQRNLHKNQKALGVSFNRLSSGFRVNTAADAADGVSMAQTAEGALNEVHDILGRMRELSTQASNGSLSDTDRGYLNTEFTALKDEITRIQGSTKFNGVDLIAQTSSSTSFQIGLDNATNDQISVSFGGLNLSTVTAGSNTVGTLAGAQAALGITDAGIASVSSSRAGFGAVMNRLDVATANIQTMRLNLSAANSRIRDVD